MSSTLKHRLFFAVWPDAAARARLAALADQLAQDYPARWIRPARYHLTLLFLGTTDRFDTTCAGRALVVARQMRVPAFTWHADTVRGFHATRPPCVLTATGPCEWLVHLRRQLAHALAGAGIVAADRRPYVPHVTLGYGRDAPIAMRSLPPLAFRARTFALLHSVDGAPDYEVLGQWTLNAVAPSPH